MDEKVLAFSRLVEEETKARYKGDYPLAFAKGVYRFDYLAKVKPGRVYIKVDVGNSGAFMIEKATGKIFGIQGYGKVHRGHQYGTLDTTAEWNWGGYKPSKKQAGGEG